MKHIKTVVFLLVFSMMICTFSACKEEKEALSSSETKATSGEISSSTTESSVADTGSAAPEVSYEVSDDTSTDTNEPMQETDIGIKAMNKLEVLANENLFWSFSDMSEEEYKQRMQEMILKTIHINEDINYDESIGATLTQIEKDGKIVDCCTWEIIWEDQYNFKERAYFDIPLDDPTFVRFCEIMEVPSNKLSQLKFTPDQIKCLDEEKAQALIACFEASREFMGY